MNIETWENQRRLSISLARPIVKKTKNKRYKCKVCPNKTTHRQLKRTNGHCLYCKTELHHKEWMK